MKVLNKISALHKLAFTFYFYFYGDLNFSLVFMTIIIIDRIFSKALTERAASMAASIAGSSIPRI